MASPTGGAGTATRDGPLGGDDPLHAGASAEGPPRGIGKGTMEAVAALLLAAVGALAIWDSRRVGAGWGADGPQGGYFPFWLGVILVGASAANLVVALRHAAAERRHRGDGTAPLFVEYGQLRLVAAILAPTAVFVFAVPWAGIYAPAALFVAYFMVALGRFGVPVSLASGAAAALVLFVVFETWLLVPLPKGPVEEALGF